MVVARAAGRRRIRAGVALSIVAAVAFLGGCGFTLQGNYALAPQMQSTLLNTRDPETSFARELTDALATAGNQAPVSASAASAVLTLHEDNVGERILSVSPSGVPEEFELFHTVRFSLAVDGREVIPAQTLVVARDYRFDVNDVLGKRRERAFLQDAIRDDLVGLLMRQFDLLARRAARGEDIYTPAADSVR